MYKVLFTTRYSITETFINLNSITRYSKNLYLILNIVFYLFPFFILIRLKAFYRLSLVNYFIFLILFLESI